MKKVYTLTDIDCPVCAGKVQDGVAAIPGVISAKVDFLKQQLTIEAEEKDFKRILKEAGKVVKKVEPDCEIEEED